MEVEVDIKPNRRNGSLSVNPDKFWDRMKKPMGCWLYDGCKEINGYGYLQNPFEGSKFITAHKLAWILKNGPVPEGMYVLHRCDIRACCNPDHLFLGTNDENIADMKSKGRGTFGERGRHKLTEAQAIEVKALKGKVRAMELARKYNVTYGAISAIWAGRSWTHLP